METATFFVRYCMLPGDVASINNSDSTTHTIILIHDPLSTHVTLHFDAFKMAGFALLGLIPWGLLKPITINDCCMAG